MIRFRAVIRVENGEYKDDCDIDREFVGRVLSEVSGEGDTEVSGFSLSKQMKRTSPVSGRQGNQSCKETLVKSTGTYLHCPGMPQAHPRGPVVQNVLKVAGETSARMDSEFEYKSRESRSP